MATRIQSTPDLEGEDAVEFIKNMSRPVTAKQKESLNRIKTARRLFQV